MPPSAPLPFAGPGHIPSPPPSQVGAGEPGNGWAKSSSPAQLDQGRTACCFPLHGRGPAAPAPVVRLDPPESGLWKDQALPIQSSG